MCTPHLPFASLSSFSKNQAQTIFATQIEKKGTKYALDLNAAQGDLISRAQTGIADIAATSRGVGSALLKDIGVGRTQIPKDQRAAGLSSKPSSPVLFPKPFPLRGRNTPHVTSPFEITSPCNSSGLTLLIVFLV